MVEGTRSSHRCGDHGEGPAPALPTREALERAAGLLRAAGDPARLALLHRLDGRELCVSELAAATRTKLSTLSQQLKVLHAERMVTRRREGKHIYYSLADDHVRQLVHNAVDHAGEPATTKPPRKDAR